jgi:hypothetical protein
MVRTLIFLVVFGLTLVNVQAQKTVLREQGSWFSLPHNIKISNKLSIGHLSQMRRVEHFDNLQVVLLLPRINYAISKNLSVGVGYVYFRSFPNGVRAAPIKRSEHRIWQHFTHKANLGSINMANRFVFEQRYKDIVNTTVTPYAIDGRSYAQRLRYRLMGTFKVAQLSENLVLWGRVSNEIRVRFKGGFSEGEFDQNNLYGFLGINLFDNSKLWLGYGRDYKKVKDALFITNDIIHVSMSYDLDLRKKS